MAPEVPLELSQLVPPVLGLDHRIDPVPVAGPCRARPTGPPQSVESVRTMYVTLGEL